MANWKNTLDLKDVWQKPEKDCTFTYKNLAEEIVKRIKSLPCYAVESRLQNICTEFEYFDDEGDADDLDFLMNDLYDWADEEAEPKGKWPANRKCWINTTF